MKVKVIAHTETPELVVATAAKLCYAGCNIEQLMAKQSPEEVESFIARLEEMGHESPMEHVSFTFAIEGVSRITEQQLTRHRIASYSIQSGRYVNRNNAEFYEPEKIAELEEAHEIYSTIIEQSKQAYENISNALIKHAIRRFLVFEKALYNNDCSDELLLNVMETSYKEELKAIKKAAIEDARAVFPNSLKTKIICTMNVRTLINFFKHRLCFRAQKEIRDLALLMRKEVKLIAPNLFKHAGAPCLSGICPENSMQCSELKGKIPTMNQVRLLIKEHWKPA